MFKRRLIAIVAALCGVCALWAWGSEYRAFALSRAAVSDWYLTEQVSGFSPTYSVEGTYLQLQACDNAMTDPYASVMPTAKRRDVAKICLSMADHYLKRAPQFALAHLVRAEASWLTQSPADAVEWLVHTEQLSGGLMWMTVRRIDLAVSLFDHLGDEGRAALARDIGRMLTGRAAEADWLAARYQRAGDAKAFFVETIDALPEALKARFLYAVDRTG